MVLDPGDIINTGTPAGRRAGPARQALPARRGRRRARDRRARVAAPAVHRRAVTLVEPGSRVDRSTVVDARRLDLAEALRAALRGEVAFDGGDARGVRDGRVELPPGADRRRLAASTTTTWSPRSRVCAEFDAPVLARGGGTSLAGQCCNVAVVIDCRRHMTRILELDPGARTARVQPGVVLDDLRARGRGARPDLRPRPGDARPVHARRDDRQQLLRRALAVMRGQDRRQRRRAGRPDLRRHCACASGATTTTSCAAIVARRRTARRDLRAAARDRATGTPS